MASNRYDCSVTQRRHLLLALILTAAIVLPRAYLLSQAHNESSDDDYHLVRGLEFLHRDRGLVHRELNDPPLGQALGALPLFILGGTTHVPEEGTALYSQKNYTPQKATTLIAVWKAILFLPIAATVFLWCLRLYGPRSAYLALALIVFDPTIAAHTHVAGLDVLATGAILIACCLGWGCFEHPTRGRIVAASLATAAALLTKHTAILVPVTLIAYACVWKWKRRGAEVVGGAHPTKTLAAGAVLTLTFVWTLLLFDVSPVRGRPLPAGLYIQSLSDAARHAREPNDAYLLGQTRRGGWWYYFPVVAAHKIPLPTAAIIVLGVASLYWRRPTRDELSLLIPAALYTIFLLTQPIQIGWRHALPAYLPIIMLASRAIHFRLKTQHAGLLLATGHWLLASLTILDSARHHPDYIACTNRPIPRPYEIFSDSNLDWGQSLKQAAQWIDAHPNLTKDRPVHIRPFAAANRAVRHHLGDRALPLRFGNPPPTSGLLIISPVCLTGVSESDDEYAFLRGIPPHHTIGRTLYVYDLDRLRK
jgi:hypothetical protein